MIFALVLTPVMVYLGLGGADQMNAAIQQVAASTGKEYGSLFAGTTFIGIISTAAWGLGYFGQPHILARFMAAESAKSLVSARRIGMTWMVLCMAGAVAVGYFGIAYFGANPAHVDEMNGNHERIFIALATLPLQPLDCRYHLERDSRRRNVYPVLPIVGLLQRDYRRLL